MDRMSFGLALAGVIALGRGRRSRRPCRQEPSCRAASRTPPARPMHAPGAWLQGDPADSLYRAAREALDRRDYRQAADLFAQVPARFPRSGYAADAYYWQAFALYRLGGTAAAPRRARGARHPARAVPQGAPTKGDAKALASRIQGELARRGDPRRRRSGESAADGGRRPAPTATPVHRCRPCRRVHRSRHASDGAHAARWRHSRCADDDDDTKLAALNALHPDGRRAGARRSSSGCWRGATRLGLPPPQGGLPGRAGGRRRDRGHPARGRAQRSRPRGAGAGGVLAVAGGDRPRGGGARLDPPHARRTTALQEKAIFALSQHGSPARQRRRSAATPSGPICPTSCARRRSSGSARAADAETRRICGQLFGRLRSEALRQKVLFSSPSARRPGEPALAARRSAKRPRRSSCASRRSSGPGRAAPRWRTSPRSTPRWTTARCGSS